jgi:hypothetical protein
MLILNVINSPSMNGGIQQIGNAHHRETYNDQIRKYEQATPRNLGAH